MRYTYVKECRYAWCAKTSCLRIQPRFSTCNSGLKVEYVIVEWLQEWLCLHISAHFTVVWCQKISDCIVSLSYKTSLLTWQRVVGSKHFSTSTGTREIRQREVVAKAKGVPKLLLVQSQSVFFDWNNVQPRAGSLSLFLVCCTAWSRSGDNDSSILSIRDFAATLLLVLISHFLSSISSRAGMVELWITIELTCGAVIIIIIIIIIIINGASL